MDNSRNFLALNLEIADIIIGLESKDMKSGFSIRDSYEPFITTKLPKLKLTLYFNSLPKINLDKNIFYSDTLDLYSDNGRYIFFYKEYKRLPYMTVITDRKFRELDLYYRKSFRSYKKVLPFDYPFDERLFISLLSQRKGLLVHACGVKLDNKGYLFMGPSGAGKSTMARLLNEKKKYIILSDDRVALRKIKDRFFIYGTPWSGREGFISNQKARLEKIFFLRHEKANIIRKASMQESVSQLTICSFLPLWDGILIDSALKTLDNLIQEIPCFSLDFVPDRSVLELINSNL